MKVVAVFIAVSIISGAMFGCQQDSIQKDNFRQVLIGSMQVNIPTTWERPEEYAELAGKLVGRLPMDFYGLDMEQVSQSDFYQFSKSGEDADVALTLFLIDVRQWFELRNIPWEGWEALRTSTGVPKEYVGYTVLAGIIDERLFMNVEGVTEEVNQKITLHDNEALELQYISELEGIPSRICTLVVFAPEEAGFIVMTLKAEKWNELEETWGEIRDSVEININ